MHETPRPPWKLAAFAALAATAITERAEASESSVPPPPTVHWSAPAPCADERSVRETVARWIALSPDPLDASAVEAHATVAAVPSGFELTLSFGSSASEGETVAAERCESLVQVVALKVALAAVPADEIVDVDPRIGGSVPEPRDVSRDSSAVTPPEAEDRLAFGLRVPVGVTTGVLPSAAVSLGLMGLASLEPLQLEVGGTYLARQKAPYDSAPEVGASFDLLAGIARACPGANLWKLRMRICAGAMAGVIRATGFGTPRVWTATEPWLAGLLGSSLTLPVTDRWKIAVGLDATLAITCPTFALRGLPPLHQPESSALGIWLGLEYWPG